MQRNKVNFFKGQGGQGGPGSNRIGLRPLYCDRGLVEGAYAPTKLCNWEDMPKLPGFNWFLETGHTLLLGQNASCIPKQMDQTKRLHNLGSFFGKSVRMDNV